MTEAEWLGHAVPGLMLRHVSGIASARKLHLFTCNCAVLAGHAMLERDALVLLELAWAAADGSVSETELAAAVPVPAEQPSGRNSNTWADKVVAAALCTGMTGALQARQAFESLGMSLASEAGHNTAGGSQAARTSMASLLRDIFGNPFRPVTFSPAWRTDTALSLACQMYESREFGAMPILADALQDAGCDNEDILSHCRCEGPHVRGCWVVDLVLGRQ